MEWSRSGLKYYHGASREAVGELPPAIYRVDSDPREGSLFLVRVQDKFPLPEKIYGMDDKIIGQVRTACESGVLTKNIGVLLTGMRGTGKTIAAKQLCNLLGLPVLMVPTAYSGFPRFLNDIKQKLLIFVDEYEKVYCEPEDEAALLSTMDGAMDNGFQRVFLLTTNSLEINKNLLQRPARLRYVKEYSDLEFGTICEVVDDVLKHPKLRDQVIEFISCLQMITIDIVKAVLDEVNIFGQPPNDFKDIFNAKTADYACNLYAIKSAGEEPVLVKKRVPMHRFNSIDVGRSFRVDDFVVGQISQSCRQAMRRCDINQQRR